MSSEYHTSHGHTVFTARRTLTTAERDLILAFLTNKKLLEFHCDNPLARISEHQEQIIDFILHRDFSEHDAAVIIHGVMMFHRQAAESFTFTQKLQQLRMLCYGYHHTLDESWAHSIFIDLVEHWMDCNVGILNDTHVTEVCSFSFMPQREQAASLLINH